jgi:hypothetical protein
MKGQSSFGSGDINLAAAILTMGIPMDPANPIELIARDNGHDYTRFHFLHDSACGKYDVWTLSSAWTDKELFSSQSPGHPFALIMDFITARPRGCSHQDAWLAHAAAFLDLHLDAIRKTYADISRACSASPESPVSYVCAFIRNRMDLITASKRKADSGNFSNMMSAGKSVSIIPAKAPARIRDFLLSHIR